MCDRRLFLIPVANTKVNLEVPAVSYEKPEELITIARRKLFHLPIKMVPEESIGETTAIRTGQQDLSVDDHLSVLSFSKEDPKDNQKLVKFATCMEEPQALSLPSIASQEKNESLLRAKLVARSSQDHILVLSFPAIVCDYWSSCLFVQQLAEAYSKLEKSPSYRPSLITARAESKRRDVIHTYEKMRGARESISSHKRSKQGTLSHNPTMRLLQQKRAQEKQSTSGAGTFIPQFPARALFQQVALRESQLLLIRPRERLWTFWESGITATIRRLRGPSRVKVVSPIRIPSGLGEMSRLLGPGRPTTARLRPLTARARPQTSRNRQLFADPSAADSMSGAKKVAHLIKVCIFKIPRCQ